MSKIIIGCVGDDFSGSSDAASFLAKEGIKTILFNGTPKDDLRDLDECIAVVIALKTRTQETSKAVSDTLEAFEWLKENGANQLFVKYCSTFDSTKEGNIGPIVDSVLEKYNIKYTVLCPALPVNGRTVVNGHLYVNGIPLHETHMKEHPLTPMWDSDISKLMEPQGKYPCLKINYEMLEKGREDILKVIEDFGWDKEHFYVIPDYSEERHAKRIVDVFGELQLLTGGSGLMTQLSHKYKNIISSKPESVPSLSSGKAIILAGSCSKATLEQIEDFKGRNGKYIKIDPIALMDGSQTKEDIWRYIESINDDAVLVYSSDSPENVKKAQEVGSHVVSELLEQTAAYLARKAAENGFNRIIAAGGETSGAVTKNLGYDSYLVGDSIAPGVPVMIPLKNTDIRLVLKSGNFGKRDFFTRAINKMKGMDYVMDKKLAVIFDMDGVLVDSEHAMVFTSIESLKRFGINPCREDFVEFTGMGEDAFIGGVARKYGLQYSIEMKDYAYKLYLKEAQNLVVVFPNVKNVLLSLKDEGLKMAVASAADFIKVEANLKCIGVDVDFFDAVVTGSEVKNKKPDPEIFLKAAEKIGVQPECCIVVEDALSGIKAAKAAGMASVGVTTSFDAETLLSVEPDFIVNNLEEALGVIQKWEGRE